MNKKVSIAQIELKNHYPFGMVMGQNIEGDYRYAYQGENAEEEELGATHSFEVRLWDARIGRWLSVDPLVGETGQAYIGMGNNPINRIDPDGALDAPIYDEYGNFLGTDDQGLQGKVIVMNKDNFTQGMSHEDALKNSLGAEGLNEGGLDKLLTHKAGLKDRPDWDGFVAISEGIDWAKKHPNTLPGNITPDNSLYLDVSKLNYGDLSASDIGLGEGKKGNVNLFDYVNWFSSSSRSTTYALGNTQMKLLNSKTGSVKLFWDDYNWDYHNYPQSRRNSGKLPESKRDKMIYYERKRARINDSHGFRVFIYGTGKIKTD